MNEVETEKGTENFQKEEYVALQDTPESITEQNETEVHRTTFVNTSNDDNSIEIQKNHETEFQSEIPQETSLESNEIANHTSEEYNQATNDHDPFRENTERLSLSGQSNTLEDRLADAEQIYPHSTVDEMSWEQDIHQNQQKQEELATPENEVRHGEENGALEDHVDYQQSNVFVNPESEQPSHSELMEEIRRQTEARMESDVMVKQLEDQLAMANRAKSDTEKQMKRISQELDAERAYRIELEKEKHEMNSLIQLLKQKLLQVKERSTEDSEKSIHDLNASLEQTRASLQQFKNKNKKLIEEMEALNHQLMSYQSIEHQHFQYKSTLEAMYQNMQSIRQTNAQVMRQMTQKMKQLEDAKLKAENAYSEMLNQAQTKNSGLQHIKFIIDELSQNGNPNPTAPPDDKKKAASKPHKGRKRTENIKRPDDSKSDSLKEIYAFIQAAENQEKVLQDQLYAMISQDATSRSYESGIPMLNSPVRREQSFHLPNVGSVHQPWKATNAHSHPQVPPLPSVFPQAWPNAIQEFPSSTKAQHTADLNVENKSQSPQTRHKHIAKQEKGRNGTNVKRSKKGNPNSKKSPQKQDSNHSPSGSSKKSDHSPQNKDSPLYYGDWDDVPWDFSQGFARNAPVKQSDGDRFDLSPIRNKRNDSDKTHPHDLRIDTDLPVVPSGKVLTQNARHENSHNPTPKQNGLHMSEKDKRKTSRRGASHSNGGKIRQNQRMSKKN